LFAGLPRKVAAPETAVVPGDASPRLHARLLPMRAGLIVVAIALLIGGHFGHRLWILIAVVLVIAVSLGRGGRRHRRRRERL
jgi:Flp pilus assembly protein TadB